MEITQRKEQFSQAYVRAIAAQAGCNNSTPTVDNDSIDISLIAKDLQGCKRSRAQIDIQLKCTGNCNFDENVLHFPLPIKNYNDLRDEVSIPRLLIVVCVPPNINEWTYQTEEELALRNCGYWYSLANSDETTNKATVTLQIPKTNIFSVDFLQSAMQKAANGQAL